MNITEAFTIRLDDECDKPNGQVIATHRAAADAIAQARGIANSGYWCRHPVGFATVYQGRREVAAFHYTGL